ncbi:MAG: hypothetical protein M3Y08_04555 [Fibrobacterota bacterium]|nr:hypothetical protein [Fibrobacterota bacterium]
MKSKSNLTETDLQLYLAGALPLGKRLMFAWAVLVDRDLRADLRGLEEINASFRKKEMRRLQGILFPAPLGASARAPDADRRGFAGFFPARGPRAWGPALVGALSLSVLCALPWYLSPEPSGSPSTLSGIEAGGPDWIAKGRGLGVNLFVKGDSAYRVENQTAHIAPMDTLQVVPLGSEAQHLVLLGWDARQGLVRVFPKDGARARRVSRLEPPPALLLQDMAENRLICITAVGPFLVSDAEAALRNRPYPAIEKAPFSYLHKGLYLQIFSITKGRGRI